ncbi:MAG: efflux RND transporter periplasmic adaptor subunit [Opitutaceae bacterium]|nr:efflux RND transporter periplasmic adaptor subunit [Opitutaceae bacterium]
MRRLFPLPLLPVLACVVSLAALSACKKENTGRRQGGPIPVEVAEAVQVRLPLLQRAIGAVQPLRTVNIKSQIDGVIAILHAREGDEVQAGALLVSIDKRPFENAVAKARADLETAIADSEQAARNAERYTRLAKVSAISEEEESRLMTLASTSAARVASQRASLAGAELQLGYTEIRAPFAGRIGQFALHEGALVKANDAATSLLTLHQLEPIAVSFTIPDSRQTALRRALERGPVHVTVTVRDESQDTLTGEVTFVDNAIDPLTGTLTLKAEFENREKRLWPGAFVDVALVLDEVPNAIVVPDAAVQNGQNGQQVFVLEANNTVSLRPVTIGLRNEGMTQVVSGVQAGERVVTDGQLRLTPGAPVQLRNRQETAAPVSANSQPAR